MICIIQTKYQDIYIDDIDVYKKQKNGTLRKLSKWIDNLGYYMVAFRIDGKRKYIRIHRLIAETLLPNPLNLPMVIASTSMKNGKTKKNTQKKLLSLVKRSNSVQLFMKTIGHKVNVLCN